MTGLIGKLGAALSTRTFAFAWTGLLFAFYGGMFKNAFPEAFGSLMLASACFVMGGYMIGSALVNHLYQDMVSDMRGMISDVDGNIDNLREMQHNALMAIEITDKVLTALEGEIGKERVREIVRNATEKYHEKLEQTVSTLNR